MKRYAYSPEDDRVIRELAGKVPARLIAEQLGKPKHSIHHRIKKLGLDGRLVGEHHWNARLPDLTTAMIGALADAGFTVNEIHRVFHPLTGAALNTINDITACRTRTHRTSYGHTDA